ncbi:RHS repeat-associated core domain-containing protein [Streptomyces sp. NPDC051636]|uniref:RHS repeat-associated core domain-containing protein n=1 Tax=Streptomyces sp. NPDC051636 TaxID=3365663 RepID=UPI0037890816
MLCDATGLPLQVTDPMATIARYERDAFGRVVAATDATGATTRWHWTAEGRLLRRTAPDGTVETWTYDGEGNCLSHQNPVGAVTSFEYTYFDLVAARTGPDGVRREFVHDTELRLVQVLNPDGSAWSYEYDAVGRLVAEVDFDGRGRRYAYDGAGRLSSRTNALGQTVHYERNALGQMVRKDAAGLITTFAYAPSGRLVAARGPDAFLSLELDERGLRRSETVNGRTLSCSYDELGRRTSRRTPGGATSTWRYDAAGRAVELTASEHAVVFHRDESGRETGVRFGEAVTLAHTFDARGRLATQSVLSDIDVVQRRAFSYRPDGALIGVHDQLNGSGSFELDGAGRVTAVRAQDWTETYAYDDEGNQTFADWPDVYAGHEATGQRTYAGTRILRAGGVRYEHDDAGRIVLRQKARLSRKPDTWRYVWDAEDRLVSLTTPDGSRWIYRYDPLGRRVAKQRVAADGGDVLEETLFTWDGHTLCEQTTEQKPNSRSVVLTWDHQRGRPLVQRERLVDREASPSLVDERFFAIVTDLVGTPTELIGSRGDIAWRARATLWGTTTWNANATAYTPLRFPGQYFDAETGLHYNYFRTYDPETARYLAPDPLGLAAAPNPVTYVHNPHTWIDPLGLAPECGEPAGRTFEEAKVLALREAGIPEGAEPLEVDEFVSARGPEWQGSPQLMTDITNPSSTRKRSTSIPTGRT